jgi:hypothetical protein
LKPGSAGAEAIINFTSGVHPHFWLPLEVKFTVKSMSIY